MAWILIGENDYRGLSSEAKPTEGVKSGSTGWELDTKKGWTYSGEVAHINPLTGDGWWGV